MSLDDTKSNDTVIDAKMLEDVPDNELREMVQDLQAEVKRMKLENQIYENFLIANEPSLIASMAQTLEAVKRLHHTYMPALAVQTAQLYPPGSPGTMSRVSGMSMQNIEVQSGTLETNTKGKSEKGPRINYSLKTDLVMREIEEMQVSLKKFIAVSHRKKSNLKAEIEESNVREEEVQESREDFEQSIVKGAVEKLTQKIPAEKFVRYMQEWFKTAQFMLEKLRLRTSSLRIQQAKLKNLLVQKEELGECVHEVDFEKLMIENKNFQISIEQKNGHLLELKRINGRAGLMLTTHKKILQKQDENLRNVKKTIKTTQRRILELEEENEITEEELAVEKEKYKQLKKTAQLYQVPDVMEYIRKKAELDELNKNLRTWRRKRNIQKIALATYTKMMMHLTGIMKARPSWYDMDRSKSEDIIMDDYPVYNDYDNADSDSEVA